MSALDMKAIELAAASSDARVRGAALRRMEIAKELEQLDPFLEFYAAETVVAAPVVRSTPSIAARMASKEAVKSVAPAKPTVASPKGKTAKMVETVSGILLANGQPMRIDAIYDRMSESHPDLCASNVDSMRARLYENRTLIARLDGRGYWPVGVEAPSDV